MKSGNCCSLVYALLVIRLGFKYGYYLNSCLYVFLDGDANAEKKDAEKEKVDDGTNELAGQLKELNVNKHTEEKPVEGGTE